MKILVINGTYRPEGTNIVELSEGHGEGETR
jgi:hypothetical protein